VTSSGPNVPPGWYPDPAGQRAWRWWDGYRWTEHSSDPSPAATFDPGHAGHPYLAAELTTRLRSESTMAPWAKWSMALLLVGRVLSLWSAWASRTFLRSEFHQIRVAFENGVVQTHPKASDPAEVALRYLALVVGGGAYVLFLVWQYRAANTARALGLPAQRSPGLGVGSWFIPVVNFWFPYQALRDCLPVGDEGRHLVLKWWWLVVSSQIVGIAAGLLVLVSGPVGTVTSVVYLGLSLAYVVVGLRVIDLISIRHRQLIQP
jgi:hypothetical protein